MPFGGALRGTGVADDLAEDGDALEDSRPRIGCPIELRGPSTQGNPSGAPVPAIFGDHAGLPEIRPV